MPPTFTDEGIRAAALLRSQNPESPVLVLSHYVEERYAADLIASDTRGFGYLLKDRVADVPAFLDAVAVVGAGGTVLDPEVVSPDPGPLPPPQRARRAHAARARGAAADGRGQDELGHRRRPAHVGRFCREAHRVDLHQARTWLPTRARTAACSRCCATSNPEPPKGLSHDHASLPHHRHPPPRRRSPPADAPRSASCWSPRRRCWWWAPSPSLGVAAWGISTFRVITDIQAAAVDDAVADRRHRSVYRSQCVSPPTGTHVNPAPICEWSTRRARAQTRCRSTPIVRTPGSRSSGEPLAVPAMGPRRRDHRGAATGPGPPALGDHPAGDGRGDRPGRPRPTDRPHRRDGAVVLSGSARRIEIHNVDGEVVTRDPISCPSRSPPPPSHGDINVDFAETAPRTIDRHQPGRRRRRRAARTRSLRRATPARSRATSWSGYPRPPDGRRRPVSSPPVRRAAT